MSIKPINRRTFLRGAAGLLVPSLLARGVHAGLITHSGPRRFGSSGGGASFDFYISPTGTGTAGAGGTFADPWSIAMLNDATARARYAGTSVGMLDGTYDLSGMTTVTGGNDNLINVASGVGTPTTLQSVNPQAAIIDGHSGASYPHIDCGLIGNVSDAGNVIFDGLKIVGFGSAGMTLGNSGNQGGATRSPGYIVRNCELTGGDIRGTAEGGNHACIKTFCTQSPRYYDNWFHDNIARNGAGSTDHFSDILVFHVNDFLAEYCTFSQSGGVYGKWSTCVDVEMRYCYFDFAGYNSETRMFFDFNSENCTGYIKVHHCVFVGPSNDLRPTGAFPGFTSSLQWYNNTHVHTAQGLIAIVPAGNANIYNNIFTSTASGDQAFITINLDANGSGPFDYNLYYNPTDAKWGSYAGNAYSGQSRTGYSSFASWQAAMGGSVDANSISGSDPLFVMTGSNAAQYQLTPGSSPAEDAGKSDGTSGGTTVDMGAWGNGATAIGHRWSA